MHIGHKRYCFASLILSLLLVTGCGAGGTLVPTGDSQAVQTPLGSPGNSHQVMIQAASFEPLTITIAAGDTVVWLNRDSVRHTVTAVYHFQDEDNTSHVFIGEAWDSGYIAPGQSYSRTFGQSGTFEYLSLPLHTPSPLDQYFEFVVQHAVGVVIVN